MTVKQYLERKHALLNTTAYRINGQTFIGPDRVPVKEWERMHALPDRLVQCKENPDKRRQFLIP
jgi:hypothetical protein